MVYGRVAVMALQIHRCSVSLRKPEIVYRLDDRCHVRHLGSAELNYV